MLGEIMRDKIIRVFIEKKRKPNISSGVSLNSSANDDIQKHLLQKPIQTGYSINIP
jgi:hypothetical protein